MTILSECTNKIVCLFVGSLDERDKINEFALISALFLVARKLLYTFP